MNGNKVPIDIGSYIKVQEKTNIHFYIYKPMWVEMSQ